MIELQRVRESERPELNRLVDVYLAELLTHRDEPVGPTDAASYVYLPLYWAEPGRHPFFIEADGERVGLVLVREVESRSYTKMAEFYVRPQSRRIGVGRAALDEQESGVTRVRD